ncbi:MAG TPA: GNAT family N-acetyltransferase [Hyphomonadaceae bacterium]|nr:GNAT family N-acetyltransferase [Hyphomonadaceae bacterium]
MYAITEGRPDDFADVERLVERTIRAPFDHPDLTPEQRAENAWIVSIARRNCLAAIGNPARAVFVAREDAAAPIIGFVIALRDSATDSPPPSPRARETEGEGEGWRTRQRANEEPVAELELAHLPEIDWLIVAPEHQGRGAARLLMDRALDSVGEDVAVKLGVIHFNARAIAFYKKLGFEDTGRIVGRRKIARRLLVRNASA